MATGQKRDSKKADKRDRILNSAERLIADKGYHVMTIDEVAKEAGVAKGTVYLYFKSKEALCAAVLVRIGRPMNAYCRERLPQIKSGSARIEAFDAICFEYASGHPDQFRVMNSLSHVRFREIDDPHVQELIQTENEQLQILVGCYEEAIREGSLRSDVDPVFIALFMRMAMWVAANPVSVIDLIMDVKGVDRSAFVSSARELLMRSIYAPEKRQIADASGQKKQV